MFILQVCNYLNRSHDCFWDEPSALLAIPSLRQPLNELDFIIDKVVPEHTVLLIWRGLTIGVDEVDGASMSNKHGGVDGKAVGRPQEEDAIGQAVAILSHPLSLIPV